MQHWILLLQNGYAQLLTHGQMQYWCAGEYKHDQQHWCTCKIGEYYFKEGFKYNYQHMAKCNIGALVNIKETTGR
jgi:hypothetical protein